MLQELATRARLPVESSQFKDSASFVFGNTLLGKKFLEERFGRFAGATFHAFQSALDALDRLHPVFRFRQLLVPLSVLHD